jgi:CrcB protein
MDKLLFVGLGGAVGAMARYLTNVQLGRLAGPGAPWAGTLTVNVVGGFLMGALVGYLAFRGGAEQERLRLLLGVGVLGGYTTFSAFSLDAVTLIRDRDFGGAATYVVASVLLSIAALFVGLWAARRLFA